MVSNNFRVHVVLRILVLLLLITGTLYSIFIAGWVVTPVVLLLGIIASSYELIVYVEKTNREFTRFLLAVKSADFSKYSVTDSRGKTFSDFKKAMNIIIEEFQVARVEKEANFIFMQTVVEHLNTAIISFDKTGEIKLMNQAAKKMLHLPYLKNVYSLQKASPKLCDFLTGIPGSANPMFETNINGEQLKLSLRSTDFIIQGIDHKLVSIQNIKPEIEQTELEAWEQLLHVLTHEIMNSVTPLSSLSVTLKGKADALLVQRKFDQESMDDLSEGLNVIAKRSAGLMNFVNHYRSFTMLPTAVFKEVDLKELLENVITLKEEELNRKGINLKLDINKDIKPLIADAGLVEQVLINLINNAADALEHAHTTDPIIKLGTHVANDKIAIRVADNGPGIEKDNLDRIFIPFFTTRVNGSGIGLSLSKQIMRMHNGSLYVSSVSGHGATFSIEFP